MFTADQYELLDFGDGRKLERFGPVVLNRPCLAAGFSQGHPSLWEQAFARYERLENGRGRWTCKGSLPSPWRAAHNQLTLKLALTESGQVGLFPEQAENWEWIGRQVRAAGRPLKVLNLFAYTGGSTITAATAGGRVVHVDAARNTVAWARENARLSGLAEAPIRWIVEDAATFAHREIKRGNTYDAVILDPPSYGHGPGGEVWKLDRDLLPLLNACAELTGRTPQFILVSCHTEGVDASDLNNLFAQALGRQPGGGRMKLELYLSASDGRRLPSGVAIRWSALELQPTTDN